MKIKSILSTALLASVSLAMVTTTANALTTAKDDDLIISFRATGGTGLNTNVEIDMGNINTFLSNASTFSLSLGADLSTNFGTAGNNSTWNTRTDLLWSVVGTSFNAPVGSDTTNNNLYFTVLKGGTPDSPQSASTQLFAANNLNDLTTFLNRKPQSTTAPNGIVLTVNGSTTPHGYTTEITQNNTTVSDFGYFNANLENNTNTTGGPVTAELYSDVSGASAPQDLGTFSLSSSGVLTFTTIPEPSTYVLMGLGTMALMFWARRRNLAMA